ncbi:serine/threonine-protein kinase [Melissospora conviva]|uniref:serine/threonine-protein kinase n=1 Tax=Melissospora conviva TaxID=3388432 RepID=UPI003C15BBD6
MRTLGGRYRLEHRIGLGGMSEVWQAHDQVLDRRVAVKLLAPGSGSPGDTGVTRVRDEARAAARLVHPNVAAVHDFGTTTGVGSRVPYIVMELVTGDTLAQHLREGPLDWRIAVRVCAEVCAALAAAHAGGIVHRDIKPANIILTPAGAKVLDFGIAAPAGHRDDDPDEVLFGTPAYTAPERFDGAAATPAADIYAVGVLLHLCITGRLPWPKGTGIADLRPPRQVEPAPLPAPDGLPGEIADLYRRCLDARPQSRPTSLVAALLLAEAVDARVYIPLAEAPLLRPRRLPISPWTDEAAHAATQAAPADAMAHPYPGGRGPV